VVALRALLFDLWGTLLDDSNRGEEPRHVTRARRATQAFNRLGLAFTQEEVAAALSSFGERQSAVHAEGRDLSSPERIELLLELLADGLSDRLSGGDRLALEDALTGALRQNPPVPFAGASEVLDEGRRRGMGLGLVSNTGWSSGPVLRQLLAEQGLLPYFQVLTFSDEACLVKPSSGMFTCTLDAMRLDPQDAVFIGDSPEADVAGALAVGMWAVQIGDRRVDGIEPHARIGALPELLPALGRLGLLS
jgi:putative hydrolase of the HAD superfamily